MGTFGCIQRRDTCARCEHAALYVQVCRPSAGPCDKAEYCTGKSGDCPDDKFEYHDTVRASNAEGCAEQATKHGHVAPIRPHGMLHLACVALLPECSYRQTCHVITY